MKRKLLLWFVLIFGLFEIGNCQLESKSRRYGDSTTFALDSYMTWTPSWEIFDSVGLTNCNQTVCTNSTNILTYNLTYSDGTFHKVCLCRDTPSITVPNLSLRFSKVPTPIRRNIDVITIASKGKGTGGIDSSNFIVIFEDLTPLALLRVAIRAFDNGTSSSANWTAAVNADTCIVDDVYGLNTIGNYVLQTINWIYMVVSKQTTNAAFDCMKNQLNEIKKRLPESDIDYMINSTDIGCPAYTSGNGTGLIGTYYGDLWMTRNEGQRLDAFFNFNWRSQRPGVGIVGAENWSAQWRGFLLPPFDGEWTFTLRSDDGSKLFVNNQVVIWQGGGTVSGTINLVKDVMVPIRIEYFQLTGPNLITLSWSHACSPQTLVPPSQFYPPSNPTDCTISIGTGTGLNTTGRGVNLYPPYVPIGNSIVSLDNLNVRDSRSIVWSGYLQPKVTERVIFYVGFVGATRIRLNGTIISDRVSRLDISTTIRYDSTADYFLEAGKLYPLYVEYLSPSTSLFIKLYWQGEGCLGKEIIPITQMYASLSIGDTISTNSVPTQQVTKVATSVSSRLSCVCFVLFLFLL
eukprot:TRINITY_DN4288_c0_g1_i3.p1 TRINITY_DN4288_c0_g1~~TRINITY_DN4288_c0_g1_i3.p1  ORF type:complete len:573 (-),score=83.38 TRINITY_DN4288_c0_g1_i3:19-1737(-)